jgi:hypothetical protein
MEVVSIAQGINRQTEDVLVAARSLIAIIHIMYHSFTLEVLKYHVGGVSVPWRRIQKHQRCLVAGLTTSVWCI